MKKIYELKQILKDKAKYIKTSRNTARDFKQKGNGQKAHEIHLSLLSFSFVYRHYHIAYCELRGRTRDQIEKPLRANPLNEERIKKIKEEFAWEVIDEAVCVG